MRNSMITMEQWERERLTVESTVVPITKARLVTDLSKIGLVSGDIVVVHTAMSRIGWIVGGAVTLIDALIEVVGNEGTLIIPTHSTDNAEPSPWKFPSVPEDWWQVIRNEWPPYRPEITPTRGIGRVPEVFRKYPGVLRSAHPQVSFAAWGKYAKEITAVHPVDQPYGIESPLGKAYELSAKVLLLGTTHEANTSLHHAETKANLLGMPTMQWAAAILENGQRVWKTWEERVFESDDFERIGEEYEKEISYRTRLIGQAESRLHSIRDLIEFAIHWLEENRQYSY